MTINLCNDILSKLNGLIVLPIKMLTALFYLFSFLSTSTELVTPTKLIQSNYLSTTEIKYVVDNAEGIIFSFNIQQDKLLNSLEVWVSETTFYAQSDENFRFTFLGVNSPLKKDILFKVPSLFKIYNNENYIFEIKAYKSMAKKEQITFHKQEFFFTLNKQSLDEYEIEDLSLPPTKLNR